MTTAAAYSGSLSDWAGAGDVNLVEVPDWQGWAAHWPALAVPVITWLHGSETYFAAEMNRSGRRITAYLEGRSLRRSDFWCSVSHYTAGRTKALFGLQRRHRDPAQPSAGCARDALGCPASRRGGLFWHPDRKKRGHPADSCVAHGGRCFPDATLHMLGKDGVAPGGGSMREFLQQRLGDAANSGVHFAGHVAREVVLQHLRDATVAYFRRLPKRSRSHRWKRCQSAVRQLPARVAVALSRSTTMSTG